MSKPALSPATLKIQQENEMLKRQLAMQKPSVSPTSQKIREENEQLKKQLAMPKPTVSPTTQEILENKEREIRMLKRELEIQSLEKKLREMKEQQTQDRLIMQQSNQCSCAILTLNAEKNGKVLCKYCGKYRFVF
jgi:predicted nucleic acid-binding protein